MTEHECTRRTMLGAAGGAVAAGLAGCVGAGTETDTPEPAATATIYVVTYHWGYAVFDEEGTELDLVEVPPNTDLKIRAVNDHAYDAFDHLPDPVAARLEDFDGLARTERKVERGELPEPEEGTIAEVYEMAHGGGHDDGHGDDGHGDDGHGDDGHDDGHDDDGHDDGHGDDGHEDDGHGHDGHDEDHDDGHGDDGHDDGHDDDGHDDGHGDDGHDDHADAKLDHGFAIPDLGIQLEVPWDAEEPVEADATIEDEDGTFTAFCTIDCGYYHAHQQEDLIHADPAVDLDRGYLTPAEGSDADTETAGLSLPSDPMDRVAALAGLGLVGSLIALPVALGQDD